MNKLLSGSLYRTLVLTFLAGIAVLAVSFANRDVYSKEQVDTRVNGLEKQIELLHEDVRWIMRRYIFRDVGEADDGATAEEYESR